MPATFIVPYGDFISHEYKDGETIAFGCCRGEAALVAGVTNKGKSTLMRVIAMCAASGRGFSPFVAASSEGLRVILLDYEGSASRTQADLRLMEQNLTEDERELLTKNLFVCHAPRFEGESLTLSLRSHMDILRKLAAPLSPDIIIIDTMSAAFAPKSENDNAEISRLIMKPLIDQLARLLNCVAVIVGHIGKASREEGATREPAHKMRGGSAYGDRATTVFNVEGDPGSSDRIRVICAKEKTGNDFEITLELNRKTRWLSPLDVESTPKAPQSEDVVLSLLLRSSGEVKTGKIVDALTAHMSKRTAKEGLAKLAKRGLAHSTRRGYWKAGPWDITVDKGESAPQVQSAITHKALHDCTNNSNGDAE